MSPRGRIFAFEVFHLVTIQLYLLSHSHGLGVGVGDTRLWGVGHRWMWDRMNISQEFPIKKSDRWICLSGSEAQLGSNFTERMPSAGVRWHSWENPVYWPSPLRVYHGLTTGISKVFSSVSIKAFFIRMLALWEEELSMKTSFWPQCWRVGKDLNAQAEASTGTGQC